MELVPAKRISLKDHPDLDERWLQERIVDDPTLLGLGELEVRDVERRQPRAGRLDLLLSDGSTRYEVEIQLGSSDESHIIRTIEYWDLERRRYPQYDHVAVLVAENITSRFLNVVGLFNGFIPIMGIQLQALEVTGALTLVATRVVDLMTLATEEEDEGSAVDRTYWEGRGSDESLKIVDRVVSIIQEYEPDIQPRYTKFYIGLESGGRVRSFVSFRPRKKHVNAEFRIPQSDELTRTIEDAGLDTMEYSKRYGQYRIRLTLPEIDSHEETIRDLIRKASDALRA